jgi:NADPH-dependent ferric siderophore reductase
MPQEFEAGRVFAARTPLSPNQECHDRCRVARRVRFRTWHRRDDPVATCRRKFRRAPLLGMEEQREGEFDVCVLLHGLGRGSRWAAQCAVGDPIEISRSHALPIALDRSAEAHLFFGDETSIASSDAMIRALPAAAVVFACFEISSMERRWPDPEVVRPEAVRWLDLTGRAGSALVSWLARQSLPSAKSTTAYVTGEASLCATVYAHLVRDRGFRPSAVRAMPYWKSKSKSP